MKRKRDGEREREKEKRDVSWRKSIGVSCRHESWFYASGLLRLLLHHDIKFSYFGLTRAVCQDHSIRCWYQPLSIFLSLSSILSFRWMKERERDGERERRAPSVVRKVLADSRVGGAGSGNRSEERGLLGVSFESCMVGWYRLSRTCFHLSRRWCDPLKDAGIRGVDSYFEVFKESESRTLCDFLFWE